jgi:protein-tyrosine phosphatase
MAEGILKKIYTKKGINGTVDSAGFESFHINDLPDSRAINVAKSYGIDISQKRARIFLKADFDRFDRIYVMDVKNMNDVLELARNDHDRKKVDYVMNIIEPDSNKTVPDPFLSGIEDCDKVYKILEKACQKIASQAL